MVYSLFADVFHEFPKKDLPLWGCMSPFFDTSHHFWSDYNYIKPSGLPEISYRSTSIHNSPLFPGEIRVKHQAKAKVKVDEAAPPVAAAKSKAVTAKAGGWQWFQSPSDLVIWWGFHLQLVGGLEFRTFFSFPIILGIINHPNSLSLHHIFQRGRSTRNHQPDN